MPSELPNIAEHHFVKNGFRNVRLASGKFLPSFVESAKWNPSVYQYSSAP